MATVNSLCRTKKITAIAYSSDFTTAATVAVVVSVTAVDITAVIYWI